MSHLPKLSAARPTEDNANADSNAETNRSVVSNPAEGTTQTPSLYRGEVTHYRLTPKEHGFEKQIRMVHVDVDRLTELDDLPLWSASRAAPMQIKNRDYLDGSEEALGPRIRDLVESRLGFRPQHRITLLTQPRTWGWVFNPISIYYCWDETNQDLMALVLEVTNTPWKERHQYVVDAREVNKSAVDKALHVSPFMPMNQEYRFGWRTPGRRLRFSITIMQEGKRVFAVGLDLQEQQLSPGVARRTALTKPWSTVAVSFGIHVEALKLWLKGVPFQSHPSRKTKESPTTAQVADTAEANPGRTAVS
jgi:DUF1365 family protein